MAQITKEQAINRIALEIKDKVIPAINRNTNAIASEVVKINQSTSDNNKVLGIVNGKVVPVTPSAGSAPTDISGLARRDLSNLQIPTASSGKLASVNSSGTGFDYVSAPAPIDTSSFAKNDLSNITGAGTSLIDTRISTYSDSKFVAKDQSVADNGKYLGIVNGKVTAVTQSTESTIDDTSITALENTAIA